MRYHTLQEAYEGTRHYLRYEGEIIATKSSKGDNYAAELLNQSITIEEVLNEVNNYVNCKGGVVNSFSNWINEKNSMDYSRFVITKSQELLNFNITLGTSRDLFNQKKLINMITRECEIILGIYETPYYAK